MIAQKEITGMKPVEQVPTTDEASSAVAGSLSQPKWYDKLFIASNICLLAGLLVMAITLLLPSAALSTLLFAYPMSVTLGLALLVAEVSLFVVGAILFAWGFVWPRIK